MGDEPWCKVVLDICHRISKEMDDVTTPIFSYALLRSKFLPEMIERTGSKGKTPELTLSRVLQQIRDDGYLLFVDYMGHYCLDVDEVLDISKVYIRRTKSRGERRIADHLIKLGIDFKRERSFDDLRDKRLLKFDFFLAIHNKRCAIEFDGIQHFRPIKYFGGQEGFEDRVKKDRMKDDWCVKNDVILLRIPYTQINIIKKVLDKFIEEVCSLKEENHNNTLIEN